MIKTLSSLIAVLFLLTVTMNGFAQSKPATKSKPATTSKKPAKPVEDEEIRIGALPEKEGVKAAPEGANEEKPVNPALPPLPEIDTVAAPNDDLTIEIKKLLAITNSMNTATVVMKETINSQRKMKTASIPEEFYDRFIEAIDNGQVGRWLEIVVVKIYRQKFTKVEVSEIIKFYESPVGKKMAAEMVPIASASRAEGEKIGQYMALKIIDDLMKEGKWK